MVEGVETIQKLHTWDQTAAFLFRLMSIVMITGVVEVT